MTADIKVFIPPNICNVPGCGKSTDDYHYFVCDEHMSESFRADRRKYLDKLHRRTPPATFLLTPQRPDSGVTHEVVLHITPEMRERYAARRSKPLMSDERRGVECGQLDLGDIS
jgi:hypothetical protein